MNFTYGHPTIEDGNRMWEIASESSLDLNSSYSYLMMAKFFNDRCFVVRDNEEIVGFITGFVLKDDVYFVWQICIDDKYRGQGLAKKLLIEATETLTKTENIKFIQATVSPTNTASMKLFKSIANKHKTFFATKSGFEEDDFPDDKPEERLIQVGPLNIPY